MSLGWSDSQAQPLVVESPHSSFQPEGAGAGKGGASGAGRELDSRRSPTKWQEPGSPDLHLKLCIGSQVATRAIPENQSQRPPGPEARAEVSAADPEFQWPAGIGSTQSRPGPRASAAYAHERVKLARWNGLSEMKEFRVEQKTSLFFLVSASLQMSWSSHTSLCDKNMKSDPQ